MKAKQTVLSGLVVALAVTLTSASGWDGSASLTRTQFDVDELLRMMDAHVWYHRLEADEPFTKTSMRLLLYERDRNGEFVKRLAGPFNLTITDERGEPTREALFHVVWQATDVGPEVVFGGRGIHHRAKRAQHWFEGYQPVGRHEAFGREIDGHHVLMARWKERNGEIVFTDSTDSMEGFIAVEIEIIE